MGEGGSLGKGGILTPTTVELASRPAGEANQIGLSCCCRFCFVWLADGGFCVVCHVFAVRCCAGGGKSTVVELGALLSACHS